MTTLRDQLAELADEAPEDRGDRPSDLWDRGTRIHRRRRAGTVVIAAAACLVLVGLLGLDWQQSRVVAPAGSPQDEPALPDRFHDPSPWLPGTEETGPIGPLVAVTTARRGHWRHLEYDGRSIGPAEHEPVGISATTGEYAFLDLPDAAGAHSLSPDGRHVAYWITGPIAGEGPDEDTGPIAGYAVYDTVTGEVTTRELFDTAHGLAGHGLTWLDPVTLAVGFDHYVDLGQHVDLGERAEWATLHSEGYLVRLGQESRSVPWAAEIAGGAGNGWAVTGWGEDGVRLRSIDDSDPRLDLGPASGPPVTSPDGSQLASLQPIQQDRNTTYSPAPLQVADLTDPEPTFRRIPDEAHYFDVSGWRDAGTVLAWRWEPEAGDWSIEDGTEPPEEEKVLVAVDVETGEEEQVAVLDGVPGQFATDLLGLPVETRPAPPTPLDPRLVWGAGAGVLLAAAAGVLVWRRRAGA